ncbi:DUF5693 family protein [Alkalicoccus chagannorensis]|uniref:DUF5693 family protein n=1 Tax=Alkalicoccus chagannorensis TaxID=427072 RepID=UPI0004284F2C|nr:DUF5693 family protein [Alkalicoccus chagannorensis]
MNIVKWLWILLLICMAVSIPFLWERVAVEEGNDSYEIVIPYDDVLSLAEDSEMTEEEVFHSVSNQVQSVAIEPLTMSDLVSEDLLELVDEDELIRDFDVDREDLPDHRAYFVEVIDPDHPYTEPILEVLNYTRDEETTVEMIDIDGTDFLYMPYASPGVFQEAITFDQEAVESIEEAGLKPLPRLDNEFAAEVEDHILYSQLADMELATHLLFAGNEVTGAGEPEVIEQLASYMNELELNTFTIEFNDQQGMNTLAQQLELYPNRLLSESLGSGYRMEDDPYHDLFGAPYEVFQSSRAVDERNVDALFFNLLVRTPDFAEFYDSPQEAREQLQEFLSMTEMVHNRIDQPTEGAQSFPSFDSPQWFEMIIFAAAAAFTGIAASFFHPKLVIPAAISALVVFWGISLLQIDLLLKGIVLFLSIAAPTYAILNMKQPTDTKGVGLEFIKGAGTALVGAWFVVTLLYGTDYIAHLDMFRGVKVLAVAPLLLAGALFAGYAWMKLPVKFYHLVLIAAAAGIGFFYVTRTGNTGIALPYELEIRQAMENLFSVRPRTTEFAFGIPLLVLGLYMWKDQVRYASFLLLGGAVAFASMVGTFTHLHTPLLVSTARTLLGLGIGVLGGVILIGVYLLVKTWVIPFVKRKVRT